MYAVLIAAGQRSASENVGHDRPAPSIGACREEGEQQLYSSHAQPCGSTRFVNSNDKNIVKKKSSVAIFVNISASNTTFSLAWVVLVLLRR